MADEHDNIDPQAKTVRDSHPSPDSDASTIWFGDDPTRRPMNTEEAQQAVGDRYLVERLAGRGGMGQVFVAQDVRLQRQVAIKFIDGQITDGGRLKLLQEARSMAGLQHPGICPVYEVLIDVERPFIVMGWVDGVPLDEIWKTAELDARLDLLTGITEAVAEVHAAGLAHLDIKPSNILVDRSDTPLPNSLNREASTVHKRTSMHSASCSISP
jgi:serine/threonine protein kinase